MTGLPFALSVSPFDSKIVSHPLSILDGTKGQTGLLWFMSDG